MTDPQTLEEAWKRLEHLMDWKEHMEIPEVRDEVDAARALALAAVDAVEATEGKGYEFGMGRYECDFEVVQRRIEELGK